MSFLIHGIVGFCCIVVIIYTCSLFTNAIEHLGSKLKLGNNAVGSILAVIGTSLPETIVPLVAIFGSMILGCNIDTETSKNIAKGAIIGSPFMLSTFALFLLGIVLFYMVKTNKRNKMELNISHEVVLRNAKYFLFGYIPAILATFICNQDIKICVVIYLITLYCVFVSRTIIKSKSSFEEIELEELIFLKPFSLLKKYIIFFTSMQIIFSLVTLVVFSHIFVHEIKYFSLALNVSPLVLSLIITPFATELPECVNSVIWLLNNKDDLAFANVIGAIIFQAMIPTSIGILFTNWALDKFILVNAISVVLCVLIFTSVCLIFKRVKIFPLLFCGMFYFSYLIYLFVK